MISVCLQIFDMKTDISGENDLLKWSDLWSRSIILKWSFESSDLDHFFDLDLWKNLVKWHRIDSLLKYYYTNNIFFANRWDKKELLCIEVSVPSLPCAFSNHRVSLRREEGAVKRLHGRGCFTVAAATAPALLGQVWFAIYVNRGLHSMSVRSLNLSLADSLDLHSPLLCSSFLAARGQTSCPTSSMGETSMCYAHC